VALGAKETRPRQLPTSNLQLPKLFQPFDSDNFGSWKLGVGSYPELEPACRPVLVSFRCFGVLTPTACRIATDRRGWLRLDRVVDLARSLPLALGIGILWAGYVYLSRRNIRHAPVLFTVYALAILLDERSGEPYLKTIPTLSEADVRL
jgi:hypothetical protein